MSVCLVATLALYINERQTNADLKDELKRLKSIISDIRTQLDGLKEDVQETGIYLEQIFTLRTRCPSTFNSIAIELNLESGKYILHTVH